MSRSSNAAQPEPDADDCCSPRALRQPVEARAAPRSGLAKAIHSELTLGRICSARATMLDPFLRPGGALEDGSLGDDLPGDRELWIAPPAPERERDPASDEATLRTLGNRFDLLAEIGSRRHEASSSGLATAKPARSWR